jgi:hypothetical protein
MNLEFKEEQKFTQWWLWLLLIPIGFLPVFGIYKQLIKGESFGDKPMSDAGLIFLAVFVFALLGLFVMMKLKTSITSKGIQMSFFPFVTKKVDWTEIQTAKVLNYGFVGGWGIRLGTKYGTVYNMKGNKGLAIQLKNGKRFLVGTQKEADLKAFMAKMPVETEG